MSEEKKKIAGNFPIYGMVQLGRLLSGNNGIKGSGKGEGIERKESTCTLDSYG